MEKSPLCIILLIGQHFGIVIIGTVANAKWTFVSFLKKYIELSKDFDSFHHDIL